MLLTTWEGMPVPMPEGADSRAIARRVMKAAESIPFPSFRMSKGKLCAGEVVGTVQIGNVRINILPKTDTLEEDRDSDFLTNMLRSAGYLRQTHVAPGATQATDRDPMEMMIAEAAAELSSALKAGVPLRYIERREDSKTLRGRIDFASIAKRLPGDFTTLPVRHTPLCIENDLSHCLLWFATTLENIARDGSNRLSLRESIARLSAGWNGVRNIPMPRLDRLKLTASEARWERVLSIAKLLAKNKFIDPTNAGSTNAFTILFPLQHLFERALRRILDESLGSCGLALSSRVNPRFLLADNHGNEILRLKPDYLIHREGKLCAVADAKWKRLTDIGRANGNRREDLYQINAYLDAFNVKNALIIVPRASWMLPSWTANYTVAHSGNKIHVVAVDIEKLVNPRDEIRIGAAQELRNTISKLILSQ